MMGPGFRRTQKWWAWGLGVLAVLALGAPGGCSPEVTSDSSDQGDRTAGFYCDQIVPVFCEYAITVCGAEGPLIRCTDNARPICCQGACSRPARLVDGGDPQACVEAYAGQGAKLRDPDAGSLVSGDGGFGPGGLSCTEVLAGLAPKACQDVFELLAAPPAASVPGVQSGF